MKWMIKLHFVFVSFVYQLLMHQRALIATPLQFQSFSATLQKKYFPFVNLDHTRCEEVQQKTISSFNSLTAAFISFSDFQSISWAQNKDLE